MKKALAWLGLTLVLVCLSYFFSPKFFHSTCKQVTGRVSAVYADATKTLHLRLSGDTRNFLLPARKLNLSTLRSELVGKEVNISYRDARLALSAGNEGEIASISVNRQIVYSE